MIKNRDFWMPFRPVDPARARRRLSRQSARPELALHDAGLPTQPKRREELVAAIHPHDGTARAHILDEAWNPGYYRVIQEFERLTGIGAVLNTSYNLHGEPLVCSPDDASTPSSDRAYDIWPSDAG
jgi:carbamoyltransferase